MGMDDSTDHRCREVGTGFDDGGEGVVGGLQPGREHAVVEEDGVRGEVGFGGSPDEGAEEEGVGVGDGEEEAAGIVDGTGGAGEGEKFGEEGAGAVEARNENAGVDLVEGAEAGASSEQSLVGRGMRGGWFLGDWFHR